jgi:hypothetical protein
MAVTVTNLLQGPCDIYVAAFGATEPTLGTWTAPVSPWVDAGGTLGGVKLSVKMDFKPLEVDQVPDDVGQRMTKRTITVETMLAEATLANIKSLMNGGTDGTGTGYATFEPLSSTTAFQPTYSAILLRGPVPGSTATWVRHVICRKVLSTDGFEIEYAKDKQAGLKVKWSANYVSSSVAPFIVADQTA